MNKVILNGVDLKIEDVVNVARNGYEVEIDKECMAHIAEVRGYMEREWMRDDAPECTASTRVSASTRIIRSRSKRATCISIVPFCRTAAAWAIRLRKKWFAQPCACV